MSAEAARPLPRAHRLTVTADEYHGDPCEVPSLSASIGTLLVDRSPKHAWQAHPRFGSTPKVATPSMDRGTLIHRLVLGAGAEIAIVDAPDYRTNAAKADRDAARKEGKIPVLAEAYSDAIAVAEVLKVRLAEFDVRFTGDSEVPIAWEQDTPHGRIWCRGLLDHVEGALISDLKTCRSAHPRSCARHVVEYGYDVQRAAYVEGLEAVHPELRGRVEFVFLFCETDPPYAVSPVRLDGVLREYGERRWARAKELWARSLHTNDWPAYGPGIEFLAAPGWLMARMEEEA